MRNFLSRLSAPPWLMGILNITPDSFSDGQQFLDPTAAVAQAQRLVAQGATLLDLGAEASSFFRPGIKEIPPAEQLQRLLPVLERLAFAFPPTKPFITLDTRSHLVARQGLAAWVRTRTAPPSDLMGGVNDISAGTHDPEMFATVAALDVPIILMHIAPGYPAPPTQDDPDIVVTVQHYLAARAAAAIAAGIRPENILLDPGLGFGKTMADNWRLLAASPRLIAGLSASTPPGIKKWGGYPLVLGLSRKRFLDPAQWSTLPDNLPETPALRACLEQSTRWAAALPPPLQSDLHPRDLATAALTTWAAHQGVPIHRLHNVSLAAWALRHGSPTSGA